MRLRIRRKAKTPAARGGQARPAHEVEQVDHSYPGGSPSAGADGLPGTAGYRGGPKNKPPGGFIFQPPPHDPPKRPRKPWE